MSPLARRFLPALTAALLLAAPALRAADSNSAAEIKRVTERYALTRARIHALLDNWQNPTPLPANPPNPFYQVVKDPATGGPEVVATGRGGTATPGGTQVNPEPESTLVPEAADLNDEDTLRKYAAQLKISGVIVRNGIANISINGVASKVGDVITVGSKERPIYLKLVELTANDFTLSLNDTKITLSLKK